MSSGSPGQRSSGRGQGWARAAVVLLFLVAAAACDEDPRQTILVQDDRIVITNLTDTTWSGIDVWVNDHYRAQVATLAPEQRADIPLSTLTAGLNYRFDPRRQATVGVELTAKDSDGNDVRATWGQGRRR